MSWITIGKQKLDLTKAKIESLLVGIIASHGHDRHPIAHDDMRGDIRSAIAGGTAWTEEVMTGTPFVIGCLRNNSSDMFQLKIQVPHTRKLQSVLDSIHIHYTLQAASNPNETIVFSGSYAWMNPGQAFPATAQWLPLTGTGLTLNLGAAKPVRYYGLHTIRPDVPPPANEGYGGMLLIIITRGNGTHAANLGILDADAHTPVDREGSLLEYSDV